MDHPSVFAIRWHGDMYVKTVEEQLQGVVSTHHGDQDDTPLIFLLANRAPTRGTTCTTPASMLSGRELHLPCDLMFGAGPDNEQPTTRDLMDIVYRLQYTHHYGHQHRKVERQDEDAL
jgi:hypothetical protein